jgi:hypothetical protein
VIRANQESDALIAGLEKLRVTDAEAQRLDRAHKRYLVYCDDYQDQIKAEVRRVFVNPERANRIAVLGDSTINPFRRVVDETYAYPGAKRAFVTVGVPDANGVTPETEDPVYGEETLQEDHDVLFSEVAACLGGFRDGALQAIPAEDDEDGRPVGLPTTRLFFPHEFTVRPSSRDPGAIGEIRYLWEQPDGEEVVVGWTKEEHWVENKRGGREPAPGARDTTNPYGWLPFVAIHAGRRDSCFWDSSALEGLFQFTLQHGRDWAAFNFLQQQQSYRQIVVKGADENWGGFKDIGVGSELIVGTGWDVDVLDLQAQLAPTLEKLKTQLMLAFKSYGLDADRYFNPGQTPTSGIARLIERDELLAHRRKILPFVRKAEREFAELFRRAHNWNGRQEKIAPKAKFRLVLNEERAVQAPDEVAATEKSRLENLKTARELGVKTDVEIVAEYRGISLADATAFVAARKSEPAKTEMFGYDQENGVPTIDEVRVTKGLPPRGDDIGKLTVPEFKARIEAAKAATAVPPAASAIPAT